MTNGIPLIAGGTIVIIREHESVVIEKEAKSVTPITIVYTYNSNVTYRNDYDIVAVNRSNIYDIILVLDALWCISRRS